MIQVAFPERQVGIAVRKVLPELGKTIADSMPPAVCTAARHCGGLPSRPNAFSSVPERFLSPLQPRHKESSATVLSYPVLLGNQVQWPQLCRFRRL